LAYIRIAYPQKYQLFAFAARPDSEFQDCHSTGYFCSPMVRLAKTHTSSTKMR